MTDLERKLIEELKDKIRRRIEELRKELAAVTAELKIQDDANDILTRELAAAESERIEWVRRGERAEELCNELRAECAILKGALEDVFKLMDDQFLVRNTDNDADPGWVIKMLEPMGKLSRAHKALAASPSEALAAVRGAIRWIEKNHEMPGYSEILFELKRVFGDV